MRRNHEYWCEPECTWQTNSINKTATSERLDRWASRLWRCIELVFKSLHCFTVRPIFQPGRLLEWKVFHFNLFIFLFSIYFLFLFIYLFIYFFFWGGVARLQCIYYLVLFTDVKAAEGNWTFQASLLYYIINIFFATLSNIYENTFQRLIPVWKVHKIPIRIQ